MEYKKYIRDNLASLSKDQYIEIYKIFKNNDVNPTINLNGVFIDLADVDKKILIEIKNYIDYCKKNNLLLLKKEQELVEQRRFIKEYSDNKDKLKNQIKIKNEEYKMIGDKIVLTKDKPKYSVEKYKILKHYRDIINSTGLTCLKNKEEEEEEEINIVEDDNDLITEYDKDSDHSEEKSNDSYDDM